MLVLSRKVGESIVVGGNIHLTVVAIQGETIRLGISAPEDVIVDRQEVHEKRKNSACDESNPPVAPASAIGMIPT